MSIVVRSRFSSRIAALAALFTLAACSEDGPSGPKALVAPTGVAAAALTPTSVQITWAAVTDAGAYEVERAAGTTGGTFTQVGVVESCGWKLGAWRDIVIMQKTLGAGDTLPPENINVQIAGN